MRIGIDARFYGPESKGLGRYTEQLIRHLEESDETHTYIIFMRQSGAALYKPHNPRFHVVIADYTWYSWAEQIIFPWILLRARCDCIHFPHFNVPLLYRRPFVVTIHDLILLHYPTVRASTLHPLYYWIKFLAYRIVIGSAVRRARTICAVSAYTREDLCRRYPIACHRTIVTYEAATVPVVSTQEDDRALRVQYGIMKPYLLYVGNAYPHKNLPFMIRAFAQTAVAHTHTLVLVGKDDYFYAQLQKTVIAQYPSCDIRIIPSAAESLLHALYRGARAFIFPSLYEGFGLPPLEAMLHGCPVVASDATCMPEVLGDAAILVNATNLDAFSQAIDRVATDEALRAEIIARGYVRAQHFTWEKMAQQMRDVYERVNA